MVPVDAVAQYLIGSFARSGNPISHLKLQKLLYYAQAWNLARCGEPLFEDPLEAWVHGPVVPSIFQAYRDFRWSPIAEPTGEVKLPATVCKHLDEVSEAYGHLSAWQLERLSHTEAPWLKAREGLEPSTPSRNAIELEDMREYFSHRFVHE